VTPTSRRERRTQSVPAACPFTRKTAALIGFERTGDPPQANKDGAYQTHRPVPKLMVAAAPPCHSGAITGQADGGLPEPARPSRITRYRRQRHGLSDCEADVDPCAPDRWRQHRARQRNDPLTLTCMAMAARASCLRSPVGRLQRASESGTMTAHQPGPTRARVSRKPPSGGTCGAG
jgi:hypothetical protein